MIGVVLTVLGLGGLAALFGGKKPKGPPGPVGGKVGGYEVVTMLTGGAKETDVLPLLILLHQDLSTAEAALPLLAGYDKPLRVVVPLGTYVKDGKRAYVDPALGIIDRRKALQQTAIGLQDFIVTAQATWPSTGRVFVVGLGSSGAMAVNLGMFAPPLVRQAFGIGGVFEAEWVPLAHTWQNETYKLSWGDSIGFDKLAEETAQARDIFYQVWPIDTDLGENFDPTLTRDWFLGLLNLEKP